MYLTSTRLNQLGVLHGFCRRLGGMSLPPYDSLNFGRRNADQKAHVDANWELLAQRLQVQSSAFAWVTQVSQDAVVWVTASTSLESLQKTAADALLMDCHSFQQQGKSPPILSIRTADCLPALLATADRRFSAVVHVGWQGARLNILRKTIQELMATGVLPDELCLALGPAIGPCCLRLVGTAKSQFLAQGLNETIVQQRHGDPQAIYLDLWQHSVQVALDLGINEKNIDILRYCTVCGPPWFYSHRRQGRFSGRQLSFIGY